MAKLLSTAQKDFCYHVANYNNGTILDIATSQYLSSEIMEKMNGYATASTVRSIAQKGGIKILNSYWRGVKIEVTDSKFLYELAANE